MKKLIRLILTRIVEDVILRTESEEFDEPGKGQDIEWKGWVGGKVAQFGSWLKYISDMLVPY